MEGREQHGVSQDANLKYQKRRQEEKSEMRQPKCATPAAVAEGSASRETPETVAGEAPASCQGCGGQAGQGRGFWERAVTIRKGGQDFRKAGGWSEE